MLVADCMEVHNDALQFLLCEAEDGGAPGPLRRRSGHFLQGPTDRVVLCSILTGQYGLGRMCLPGHNLQGGITLHCILDSLFLPVVFEVFLS